MVNFRYHLVSLIAVFLALAVGVFLGAGPLQNSISSALDRSGDARMVEGLQQELTEAESLVSAQDAFVDGLVADTLAESLDGVQVALISLGSVSDQSLEILTRYLTEAGATISANVELSESWTSVSDRTYRETLATPLTSHLENDPVDSTAAGILAQALLEVLTIDSSEASLLRDILVDSQMPMIVEDTLPDGVVDAIILLGPETETDADRGEDTQSGAIAADEVSVVQPLWVSLANALANAPAGAVALGLADQETDFISILRDGGSSITTVDGLGTTVGSYNAVAALISPDGESYGSGLGATNATVAVE